MLVYRTSYFNEQVEIQGMVDHVDRLCEELETMSLEAVQSRFERIYPYLKRKEGNLRLIARIRRFNRDYVLCWLTIFRRGDRDYENFLLHRQFGHHSLDNIDEIINEWLKERKTSQEKNFPSLLPLNNDLRIWLERPQWEIDEHGMVIYESQTWLEQFKVKEIEKNWLLVSEIISKIADSEGKLGAETNWINVKLYGENNYYILYSLITTADQKKRKILFLLAPFFNEPKLENIEVIINNLKAIKSENKLFINNQEHQDIITPEFSWDDLTSLAQRAYPSYLLADEEMWKTIENDEDSNLALSAEEEAILHNVSTSKASLPLFLNGRAGSGKSTLLFHLFADYCYRHFRFCREHNINYYHKPHPIFLAYNEPITKYAQERVTHLLESHHRFLEKRGTLEDVPNLTPFFQSFRSFLKNLLPHNEKESFSESKYISFYRFRQLMQQYWSSYSPERCWLVIRTFIKGYHLDERDSYLDINDYQEIPRREQKVSSDDFKDIYNNVWKWYEKYTRQQGEWDDQDLIRTVLQGKYYHPEYTAIFCDEAQDFTRLELQLVMRLSVFCKYDLEHDYIECLPFAFAGDPLQTLNPTGFRWSSLKTAFYNEIITALAPSGELKLDMNFVELECNYRSINSIVSVTNLIQLWRKELCKINYIKPQKARKYGDFQPQKFIINNNIQPELLKVLLQDTVIIIPCDEGEEIEYIKNDDLLASFIPVHSDNIPWNILSPIAVKGLEFKQIVLYKFGEITPPELWQRNNGSNEAIKYFLNKLYVAASRATEKLFIIDTLLGDNNLWKYAFSHQELEPFLKDLAPKDNPQQWQNSISFISLGTAPEILASNDLITIAQTLEVEGLNSSNPDLLRRASGAYQRMNNQPKAILCEAEAFKIEREFTQAGQLLLTQGQLKAAWECFWEGCNWQNLLSLSYQKSPDFQIENIEKIKPLINFMVWFINDQNKSQINVQLKELTLLINEEAVNLKTLIQTPQWSMAICAYIEVITNIINSPKNWHPEHLRNIGQALTNLNEIASLPVKEIGQSCLFLADKNKEHLNKLLEKIIITNQKEQQVKEELEQLLINKEYEKLIEKWEQNGKSQEKYWLNFVIPAFEAKNLYKQAFVGYCILKDYEKVKQSFLKATDNQPTIKPLVLLLRFYIRNKYWQDLLSTLNKYLPVLNSEEAEKTGLKYDFIYEIACSELTPNMLNKKERENYEQIITKHLIKNTNWQKYLFVQHLGIALEKIANFKAILHFYQHYINSQETQIRDFARHRWIAVKYKECQEYKKQIKINELKKAQLELEKLANKWQINLQVINHKIPNSPPNRPELIAGQIIGLPKGIVINFNKSFLDFEINYLKIEVYKLIQQIIIKDTLTRKEIRIDAKNSQLTIGTILVNSSGSNNIMFNEPTRGYQGKLISFGNYAVFELSVQHLTEIIKIFL